MKVAMIMGSNSDWPKLESAEKSFRNLALTLRSRLLAPIVRRNSSRPLPKGLGTAVLMSLSPLQERRLTWVVS